MIRNFKTILLILIVSLISAPLCFSESIYENKIGDLSIEYNDVKLFGRTQYKLKRIVDKNDNIVFGFNICDGIIVKTDECVIIFNNSYILYFYEVPFESIENWYYYENGGIVQKPLMCKKVVVEIKR